jgi:hypothetical protein
MRKFSLVVFTLLLTSCSYTPAPTNKEKGSDVGGTGDLEYSLEELASNKHLLSITAAPGLMETESSIAQRIHIAANKIAARTCPDEFKFIHDPNFDQSIAGGFMKRTKSYVIKCE